jgi:hypothetical protein
MNWPWYPDYWPEVVWMGAMASMTIFLAVGLLLCCLWQRKEKAVKEGEGSMEIPEATLPPANSTPARPSDAAERFENGRAEKPITSTTCRFWSRLPWWLRPCREVKRLRGVLDTATKRLLDRDEMVMVVVEQRDRLDRDLASLKPELARLHLALSQANAVIAAAKELKRAQKAVKKGKK